MPVTVTTLYNHRVDGMARATYERQVDLTVLGMIFARCTSTVSVDRADIVRAIEERGVAIGQLFRLYNILPSFELLDAGHVGRNGEGAAPIMSDEFGASDPFLKVSKRFWRDYTLEGEGVECRIHEDIRSDLFELRAPGSEGTDGAGPGPSLGDIMAPAATFSRLPPGFTPMQRLLLTANGNVERILSSYYNQPVQLLVMLNHRRDGAVYDRQVTLILDNRQLMIAKSTCFVTDPHWLAVMDQERLSVGALFRRFNALPTFTLHSAGKVPGGFWRQYQLKGDGVVCEINETFDDSAFELDMDYAHPTPNGAYGI